MNNPVRVKVAADIYGCDRRRIYQLINDGRLKSIKLHNIILVDSDEVVYLREKITPRGMPRKKGRGQGWEAESQEKNQPSGI